MENEIVIFETKDRELKLSVSVKEDTVWLTQAQMTELFSVDRTVITRHVNNIFKEGELERESNVQKMHIANADRPVQFYNLDVIISVEYRVKSQRGIEFRQWANRILKDGSCLGCARGIILIRCYWRIIYQLKKRPQMSPKWHPNDTQMVVSMRFWA